ncbi:MAG TPA: NAD(P)/FAD-dependent oxidoreductase [Dissulfurispiraceae bacterium]|nr:NAD(P)/FAD-dependent oxidoreductase [Dissulfurispiraceae bacterium]
MATDYYAIAIGSGIGGLSAAAALAKYGRPVLVLEQHYIAGGLTQTFTRNGFTWDVGLHYMGDMAPGNQTRRILDWLGDGAVNMQLIKGPYDIVHFPDEDFAFAPPASTLEQDLKRRFPASLRQIDALFQMMIGKRTAMQAPFLIRALPEPIKSLCRLFAGRTLQRFWSKTTQEALVSSFNDEKLRCILATQWGDHGGSPATGSFGMQLAIMNHFLNGAYYPANGSGVFAKALIPVIKRAGGEIKTSALVKEIMIRDNRAFGVRLSDDTEIHNSRIISTTGASNTVRHLMPPDLQSSAWAKEILSFDPNVGHLCLYLGFHGDIAAAGATAANHWFYEKCSLNNNLWSDPENPHLSPVFISFSSLKDASHEEGPMKKHTGQMLVFVNKTLFAKWDSSDYRDRPDSYKSFKKSVENRLIDAFARLFPSVAPMIVYHELSTPLTTAHFVARDHGASYGLETTPKRFLSDSLSTKTPINGLYLGGQDAACPGIAGAMLGGVLAAAAIDPRIFLKLL